MATSFLTNQTNLLTKPFLPSAFPVSSQKISLASFRCSVVAAPSPTVTASKESKIKSVKARQIIDSRGNLTIEVDLIIDDLYQSAVPSGTSTGIDEALELKDGDKSVYGGKGVLNAVQNINEILGPRFVGVDVKYKS